MASWARVMPAYCLWTGRAWGGGGSLSLTPVRHQSFPAERPKAFGASTGSLAALRPEGALEGGVEALLKQHGLEVPCRPRSSRHRLHPPPRPRP